MKSLNVRPNGQIYGVIISFATQYRNPKVAMESFNMMVNDNVICDS